MDCNKTIDFLLERKRLCDSQHNGIEPCDECPLEDICDEQSNVEIIKSAISRLQKWSDKHPKKTYVQDFLEKFPNAVMTDFRRCAEWKFTAQDARVLPETSAPCVGANLWRNKQVRPPRRGKGEASVRALHGLVCCLIKPTTERKEKMRTKIRETKFYCKDFLEIYLYPVTEQPQAKIKSRGKRFRESSETQKLLNAKYAERKLVQLLHANFTDRDLAIGLDYSDDTRPKTPEEAQRNFQNFLRRVKRLYKKAGAGEVKYISVIEFGEKSGNVHHHIVMSGGVDRDEIEKAWGLGRANTKRLQFLEIGIADMGKYIIKDPIMHKRWTRSKNLVDPQPRRNDSHISRKKLDELVADCEHRQLFEQLYPGYVVAEVIPTYCEWDSCYHMEIRMFRGDSDYILYGGRKNRKRRAG